MKTLQKEKIENHFEVARSFVLTHLGEYYLILTEDLPHTDNLEKDKVCYIHIARAFLITCSPQSLYYGKYVNLIIDDFAMNKLMLLISLVEIFLMLLRRKNMLQ